MDLVPQPIKTPLLALKGGNFVGEVGLLHPVSLEVLLLYGLLFYGFLLHLKEKALLFAFDFSDFGLNVGVVDFTILTGLNFL